MSRKMTSGNPLKLIVLFALPLLVGNLFQQFYNMADTFIVGRTLGVSSLAAVGSTGSVIFFILGFAGGATSGLSIVTAQRFGAGDPARVRSSFATGIAVSVGLTLVLTVLSVASARRFMMWLQTPAEIFEDAYLYLIIILGGIFAIMAFNLLSNVLRAIGDSRTPLLFLVLACILNIVLDYAFILAFGMGVEGPAIATVLAQAVSALLCVWYIKRRVPALCITKEDWRRVPAELKAHLRIGLPMGFQSSIIAVGTLLLQFAINQLGTAAIAANTAGGKLDQLAAMPLMSLGMTMATYAAQNYGAGKVQRVFVGVRRCTAISMLFCVLAAVMYFYFGDVMSTVFLGNAPQEVAMAHQYLKYFGASTPALGLLFIYRYTLQGLGQSVVPTVAGVMELLMRSFAALVLTGLYGFTGACLSGPLAFVGACVPLCFAYFFTRRRLLRGAAQQQELCCEGSAE